MVGLRRIWLVHDVVQGGGLQPENQVKVEAQQTVHCDQDDDGYSKAGHNSPSTDNVAIECLVLVRLDEDPDGFSHEGDAVSSDRYEHAQELGVVFPSDAVIQIFAVVVEVANAALASLAVVTLVVNITSASLVAKLQLLLGVVVLNL